jgi:predicted metal-dependent enzyme (double-stranded beta helix superfamily)
MSEIASLDWEESAVAQREASSVFAAIDIPGLLGELKSGLDEVADVERSVEKTSHYKWFLAEATTKRFQVWLHEYKPSTHRREGHATVAHNHRFWLTSLILRGGFTDTRYERSVESDPGSGSISPVDSRRMEAGDTMVLAPDEIHALSELRDGTLSLIVQGKPVRNFSEVFEGGEVRRYVDLGAKLADLRASL